MMHLYSLLLVTLALAAPQSIEAPIRVHVFASGVDEAGLLPLEAKGKIDSANDLRSLLVGRKGKVNLGQVSSKSEADVLVEVLGREQDPKDDDNRVVHIRVTVGEYSFSIDGKDDDGGWKDASKDATKQLVKWLELNRSRIAQSKKAA